MEDLIKKIVTRITSFKLFKNYLFWQALFFLIVIVGLLLAIIPFIDPARLQIIPKPRIPLPLLGDYIGGVIGSLFALAGTVLIYASFRKQQEDSQIQIIGIAEQNFSGIFFSMLNVYRDIINTTEVQLHQKNNISDGFAILLNDINRLGYHSPDLSRKKNLEAPLLFIKEIFGSIERQAVVLDKLHKKRKSYSNNITRQQEKQNYFNIVKASMTSSQLELIKLALEKEGYMDRSTIDLCLG